MSDINSDFDKAIPITAGEIIAIIIFILVLVLTNEAVFSIFSAFISLGIFSLAIKIKDKYLIKKLKKKGINKNTDLRKLNCQHLNARLIKGKLICDNCKKDIRK